jgi:hypothetical protein
MDVVKVKADIMWAYLNKPNELSGKYQVDLCNLSDKASKALEEMGVQIKQKEGKGNFITCKSTRPIVAFDDGGSAIDGGTLGNGSKAVALIGAYEWAYQRKKGVSPALRKLVITDLVTYTGLSEEALSTEDELL